MSLDSLQRLKEKLADKKPIEISDFSTCYFCKTTGLNDDIIYCPNCSFPQRGTQTEMKNFIWEIEDLKILVKEHESSVQKGKVTLYVIAGMTFLSNLFSVVTSSSNMLDFVINTIVSIGFWGLAIWADKKPLWSMITGFSIFLVIFVIVPIIISPINIISGIIFKLFIIAGFIYGLIGSYSSMKIKKELDSIQQKDTKS